MRRERWLGWMIFAVTLGTFAPAVQLDFVDFDDPDLVTENPHVRDGFSGPGVVWALTQVHANNRTPLAFLSHMLDVELFGLSPSGHHAMNVVLHAICAVLVFALFTRMTGDRVRSTAVALLFGVHPLRVESVAWVSERRDVLSMCFGLGALLLWVRFVAAPGAGRYTLVLLAYAASLASKATFVTFPLLLLVLDYWPLRRLRAGVILEKLPFFALTLVVSVATLLAQDRALAETQSLPLALRVENAVVSAVIYLRQLVWPGDLALLVPHPGAPPAWRVVGACLVLGSVTALALHGRRARPYLLSGWTWYGVALLPVAGLVQVGIQAHADRYTYLPLLGVTWALVWLVPDGVVAARSARIAFCGLVAALALLSVRQIGHWRDGVTIFQRTLAVTSDNAPAHRNLGVALGRRGRLAEAETQYREALRLRPGALDVRYDLALLLARAGRESEAERELARILAADPDAADAHTLVATLRREQGDADAAIRHLEAAVKSRPGIGQYRRNLGLAYAQAGRAWPAERELREAVRLEPQSAEAHSWLGYLLAARGEDAAAIAAFETALRIDPHHADAATHLARLRAGASQ